VLAQDTVGGVLVRISCDAFGKLTTERIPIEATVEDPMVHLGMISKTGENLAQGDKKQDVKHPVHRQIPVLGQASVVYWAQFPSFTFGSPTTFLFGDHGE
jgi:hypothetical protein